MDSKGYQESRGLDFNPQKMTMHSTDVFSIAQAQNPQNGEWDFVLRRVDEHDPMITKDTFSLATHECFTFFDFLLTLPDFESRARAYITSHNTLKP